MNHFEVIIIGGSYAGLSAAMSLGRSLRKTLIIDSGKPCNSQTPHSHNFLTQDGSPPKEISSIAKDQVLKYDSITYYEGLVIDAEPVEDGFEITTSNGTIFTAKKIVFATGIKDKLPNIKGFDQCWGISVVHCPYCHGYEIRNKKTAIIANGDKAIHLASLVHNLTQEITIITSNLEQFNKEQLDKLSKNSINVFEKEITEIIHKDGNLTHLIFNDGSKKAFEAAYAAVPFEQNTELPQKLGCKFTETGHIEVDLMQKTSQKNVFACGDSTTMMRSVATAVYGGNITGAVINKEFIEESF
ncbi:MAG: NAD(P)/FAD-dependent oxidoreductase [Flavobacteriales bacterium]|jgi:thioredoxin reductase|nr:NAD(P)/FAD-dependent oxidoreductase [Flavobacteriales bacterium]